MEQQNAGFIKIITVSNAKIVQKVVLVEVVIYPFQNLQRGLND